MDVYTTSFTYPRRSRSFTSKPSSLDFPSQERRLSSNESTFSNNSMSTPFPDANAANDADALQKLVLLAMSLHACHISYVLADQGRAWNFQITGAYPQVMLARGMILKECPVQNRASIKVTRSEILDSPSSKPVLKPQVRRKLDDIASVTLAHIAVVNSPQSLSNRSPPEGISTNAGWSGLETERICELVVSGTGDSVELARVRLLVMLDELSGLHVESCDVDHKLIPILAGRKRSVLQTIQEETATNIYLPSPLQDLIGSASNTLTAQSGTTQPSTPGPQTISSSSPSTVYITGEFFGVQRARDMLTQLSTAQSTSLISRDTAILPRKLDWMVTERGEDLKSIMSDNATFIQFPSLGSSTSLITVFGDSRTNVQRTIRSIMQLACHHYVGSFWLLPVQFNALLPPVTTFNPGQVSAILQQISIATNAEIVFKSMCFEMHGLEHEVRAAVSMIAELDVVKTFHHEIRFQIELANEHREFISGKKNGKINKIMQTTNAKIKFETFNDYNFLIDISGIDSSVLPGLAMLQEELPAEISFHVPEAYHKRIIGVGGRSIQRIMKKYGVYVKFSNAEEFAALGGYGDNEDNVVARTPAKNAINLENLKASVMELVNPKDKDYVNETLSVPRRYHRTLLGEKSIFIHDIEAKTNSRVRFPDKETASDIVTIWGPESQVQIAATMLLDHVPFEADMPVPPSADLSILITTPDFLSLVERIKRDLQVSIIANINMKATSTSASAVSSLNGSASDLGAASTLSAPAASPANPNTLISPNASENSFKFRCQRSNSDFLTTAREMLEQFLINHNIHVYPSATTHTHKRGDSFAEAFPHFDSKVLTGRTRGSADLTVPAADLVGDSRRLRLANSSPDVKALFNAPGYMYIEEHEGGTSYAATPTDYWMHLPPMPSIPQRTTARHAEEALKRGSDSLIEAKLKEQIAKPKVPANRAQSLDLSYSLSKIAESSSKYGSSGLPPPESPTTSDYDYDSFEYGENSKTGAGKALNGGEAPEVRPPSLSFPSVYVPPGQSGLRRSLGGDGDLLEDNAEDVSRVMSNLGL